MKTKVSRPAAADPVAPRAVAAIAPAPLAALQRVADGSPATARLAEYQRSASAPALQRQAEEDELQMVQRMEGPEQEDEELQMVREGVASAPATASATAATGGLPAPLRSGIEDLSGMTMDDVRVHRNSARPAAVGARAYAQGSDIHLAPGQERHLPHEAWHVVQQRQDRVRPTASAAGVAINDDPALEQEADTMGARASTAATPDRTNG